VEFLPDSGDDDREQERQWQTTAPEPNQITQWKAQLLEGAAGVFGPLAGTGPATASVDLKSLHAKIGELTLENDFLEGALSKAGLLSAKR
jgi:hypothetical protein